MLILNDKEFVPQDDQRVTVYICGPTVYAPPHIGNLRSAVNFDVLHRVLRRLYPRVDFVRNYTDIDDKIIAVAQGRFGTTTLDAAISEITDYFIRVYRHDVEKLHVLPPTAEPRVSKSMDEIRQFIFRLIENGSAYEAHGHVLFDRQKNPTFFLNRTLDPATLNAGEEDVSYKRHPHDFVLWKPSTPDQPGWASQWGIGRPGWHIECSAMIAEHLGETIDIHGGGVDLKFPHHENECAQSHARFGKPLANYWLHNGMLEMKGKMAKSKGNIKLLDELLEQASPEAVRYFFLTAHYRQPLKFSWEKLDSAAASLRSLHRAMRKVGPRMPTYEYLGPLLRDLNTPKALAETHALAAAISNNTASNEQIEQFISLVDVMGLHENYEENRDDYIIALRAERERARAEKNFAKADKLRDELIAYGVEVNDEPMKASS